MNGLFVLSVLSLGVIVKRYHQIHWIVGIILIVVLSGCKRSLRSEIPPDPPANLVDGGGAVGDQPNVADMTTGDETSPQTGADQGNTGAYPAGATPTLVVVAPDAGSDGGDGGETVSAEPTVAPIVPTATPFPTEDITHVVASGETMLSISRVYGIDMDKIAAASGIVNVDRLSVGDELIIPFSGNTNQSDASGNTDTTAPTTSSTYIVRAGDRLFQIGLAHGVGWEKIAEANNITAPYNIQPGDELIIPAP